MSVKSHNENPTKRVLEEAAVTIFLKKGFQKTRVSDIVTEAGVAQGTFYLYFKSKEDVYREICSRFMDRLTVFFVTETTGLFDGQDAYAIQEKFRRIIRKFLKIYQDDILVAEILFRDGIGNGGLFKEIYEDLLFHFIELIRDQLEQAKEKGVIGFEDAEAGSVFLFGLIERSSLYYLILKENFDLDLLEKRLTTFILRALSFNYLYSKKTHS